MSTVDASNHFSTEAEGEPTAPGRFVTVDAISPLEVVEGLEFRPVLGENMMANFAFYNPFSTAPVHVHEEEQIVIVIEGELEFEIDGVTKTLRRGDVAVVPPWVKHGAATHDGTCLEVDVFNPPRKTLLDHATIHRHSAATTDVAHAD